MSRHRGAKPPRRCELLGEISLLSPGTFYPLSDGPSIQNHRITYDRLSSSARLSVSQLKLVYGHYTLLWISNPYELTFVSLRTFKEANGPGQITHRLCLRVGTLRKLGNQDR